MSCEITVVSVIFSGFDRRACTQPQHTLLYTPAMGFYRPWAGGRGELSSGFEENAGVHEAV